MATIHIIGAGVSGLAAATALAEKHLPVKLYEASPYAGGRCRSVSDIDLGLVDQGLHLFPARHDAIRTYLTRIGSEISLKRAPHVPFPRASLLDYLSLLRGLVSPSQPSTAFMAEDNFLRAGWLQTVMRSTCAGHADIIPARALRRYLWQRARSPLAMTDSSLQESFIQPALDYLERTGGSVYFSHALNRIEQSNGALKALSFARKKLALTAEDVVIMATPAPVTQSLLPALAILPLSQHQALTVHYACAHREPSGLTYLDAPLDIVRFSEGRISIALRPADGLWASDDDFLAGYFWRKLQKHHPSLRETTFAHYRLCREKRAGHVLSDGPATPMQHGRLLLAGDWLDPALPASLANAIASGHHAAQLAIGMLPKNNTPRQRERLLG